MPRTVMPLPLFAKGLMAVLNLGSLLLNVTDLTTEPLQIVEVKMTVVAATKRNQLAQSPMNLSKDHQPVGVVSKASPVATPTPQTVL